MTNKPKQIFHRYRLVPDDHVPASRLGMEGVTLLKPEEGKDNWLVSRDRLDRLTKHIRSVSNPTGWVEYQEYDELNRQEIYTPPLAHPEKMFTRDELFTFSRQELEAAARALEINPVSVKDEALIKKILNGQKKIPQEQAVEGGADEPTA